MLAHASGHVAAAQDLVSKIEANILFPLMSLMVGVAILVFLWGAYEFVANAESDGGRETGRRHMLYGIIGLVVMFSALAILKIAALTFGVVVGN